MTTLPQLRKPLDLTGRASANLVVDEPHGPCAVGNRVFVMRFGPFYAKSLSIKRADTGVALTANVDFKAVHTEIEPTLQSGLLVCSMVEIEPSALGVPLLCTYQALGGDYSLSTHQVEEAFELLNSNEHTVRWGQVIGKPAGFPPLAHRHKMADVYGWQHVCDAITALIPAMRIETAETLADFYRYVGQRADQLAGQFPQIDDDLRRHVARFDNPHRVTKAQVGLGNVENTPLATIEQARAGVSNSSLMTPFLIQYANEYHTSNYNNPHNDTKLGIGLGNVDNFPTATLQQALEGTSNSAFLTPYLFKAMLDDAISKRPEPTIIPPTAAVNCTSPTSYQVAEGDWSSNQWSTTVYFADASIAGTYPISSWVWIIDGVSSSGQGPKSKTLTFTRDPTQPSQTLTIPVSVSLTVGDGNGNTATTSRAFTFSATTQSFPPASINGTAYGYVRVNGTRLGCTNGVFDRYRSEQSANVGQTVTHTFDLDLAPYWSDWTGAPPGGGMDKAIHTVNWQVTNVSGSTPRLSQASGLTTRVEKDVVSGQTGADRVDVTVTRTTNGLSTSAFFFLDSITTTVYGQPLARFELDAAYQNALTVQKPATHTLRFNDLSLPPSAGEPITVVQWGFGGVGRIDTAASNLNPGGFVVWKGDWNGTDNTGFAVGVRTLTVTLTCRTATSSNVTTSKSYDLVTQAATPLPPPTINPFPATLQALSWASQSTVNSSLTASGTTAQPGHPSYPIVSYAWQATYPDGTVLTGSGVNLSPLTKVVNSSGTTVQLRLTVTDSKGDTATRTQSVALTNTLSPPNPPQILNINASFVLLEITYNNKGSPGGPEYVERWRTSLNANADNLIVLGSPNQPISSYSWQVTYEDGQVYNQTSQALTPIVRVSDVSNNVVIRLTVTDSFGLTATYTKTVPINTGGVSQQPPQLTDIDGAFELVRWVGNPSWFPGNPGVSQELAYTRVVASANAYITLGAPDRPIATYAWRVRYGDGQVYNQSGQSLTPIFRTLDVLGVAELEDVQIDLTITDVAGLSASYSKTFVFMGGGGTWRYPTAQFISTATGTTTNIVVSGQNKVQVQTNIHVVAQGSQAEGGYTITNYQWSAQGPAGTVTASGYEPADFVFVQVINPSQLSTYRLDVPITLTVTDNRGLTSSVTNTVTYQYQAPTPPPAPSDDPVADFSANISLYQPNWADYTYYIDLEAYGSRGSPSGSPIVSYSWVITDQQGGYDVASASGYSPATVQVDTRQQTSFAITLTVTAANGRSNTMTRIY